MPKNLTKPSIFTSVYDSLDTGRLEVNLLNHIEYTLFESSIGTISVVSRNGKIIALNIDSVDIHKARKKLAESYPEGRQSDGGFKTIRLLLDKYLRGERVGFKVPIDISGESAFTRKVLRELLKIPRGQVRSYRWIGKRLGHNMAARAVGQAVKRNPIPIIIPCHRVIRESGELGGFSSGIEIKKRLLALEGVLDGSERIRPDLAQVR